MKILDAKVRKVALEPFRSFAISAPAGSGKTELLTQRVLRLLAVVNDPEEILCMTFTKKSAHEMQHRVFKNLTDASKIITLNESADQLQGHQKITIELALKALAQNKKRGWNLLENPSRLRVNTIDGFCRKLASQLPIESNIGQHSELLDSPTTFCRKVIAEVLLSMLEENDALGSAVATLLSHLDNDLNKLELLLTGLLENRVQFIGQLYQAHDARDDLERNLNEVLEETLYDAKQLLAPHESEIALLADYAASNSLKGGDMTWCLGLKKLPEANVDQYHQWLGLCAMLMTKDERAPAWRMQCTAKQGFPTIIEGVEDKKESKAQAQLKKTTLLALIDKLKSIPGILETLVDIRHLPPSSYNDNQWAVINALSLLLKVLNAHLAVAFQKNQACDYTEITLAALRALGTDEAPTELALKLDYSIKHILIDEFQDTSSVQFNLLESLTRGWQPDDGRSLFIVGDPMQCLYSWRGANVGQFIQIRTSPIGGIQLEPLDLTVNFRSQDTIVKWVNHTFDGAFPEKDNISRGSISYRASTAFHQSPQSTLSQNEKSVTIDAFVDYPNPEGSAAEAAHITSLVCQAKKKSPKGSIAILVRQRRALTDILVSLQKEGLSWQATEIDPLSGRMPIIDLKSLTRALISPADRVAWLSILRAPWCGLDLNDLFQVANYVAPEENGPSSGKSYPLVMANLFRSSEISGISESGQKILCRISAVMKKNWEERYRKPFRVWVEAVWVELGGIASLRSSVEFSDCQQYFDLLERHEKFGQITDWATFERALEKLYAKPNEQADISLHVMTIHKAKGLEFDTVIIPGLNRQSKSSDHPLVLWHERLNKTGKNRLIIAPLKKTGQDHDPLFDHLRKEKVLREKLETTRVIYVGVTRAVKQLHLTYAINSDKKNPKEYNDPIASSLLKALIGSNRDKDCFKVDPSVSFKEHRYQPIDEHSSDVSPAVVLGSINRLPVDWIPPSTFNKNNIDLINLDKKILESISLTNVVARHTGTILHRTLRQLVLDGIDKWDNKRIQDQRPFWQSQLQQLGVINYDQPLILLERAINGCLKDKKNHWIFESSHQESRHEYAIGYQGLKNGASHTSIIDRCFIMEGIQWIIDYKSTEPMKGEPQDIFLQREVAQYKDQLKHYQYLLKKMNNLPTKISLYFPLIQCLETIQS